MMNYTKNYDPYKHLKQSLKEDGLPAYEPYLTPDGNVTYDDAGRIVMVPIVHLDANAYRDWFTKEFPEGKVEVIRHTAAPFLVEKALVYPTEVFEVRLYTDAGADSFKANGWGKAAYFENAEFDEVGTAVSHAFKNAMRNMGFGVDLDRETIQRNLPKFVPATQSGRIGEVEPAILQEVKTAPKVQQPMQAQPIPQPVQQQPKKAPQSAPQQNVPAPAPEEAKPCSNTPETSGDYNELFAYLNAKNVEEQPAEPIAEDPAEEEKPSDPQEASTTEAAPATESSGQTEKVIFHVLDPANDPLGKFDGIGLEEMCKNNKNILQMIKKPTFRWQGRLDEEVYKAIQNF